jgi:hypothetical protein
MSIKSYLDGIMTKIQSHPPSPEEGEIARLTLRIQALYAAIDDRAKKGDSECQTFVGEVPLGEDS